MAFVKITCAEPSQICCQVEGKDLKFLQQLLLEIYENQDLVEAHGLNAHPRVGAKSQQLFLCKYGKTWRRGTIMNWDDPRNPTVSIHHMCIMSFKCTVLYRKISYQLLSIALTQNFCVSPLDQFY